MPDAPIGNTCADEGHQKLTDHVECLAWAQSDPKWNVSPSGSLWATMQNDWTSHPAGCHVVNPCDSNCGPDDNKVTFNLYSSSNGGATADIHLVCIVAVEPSPPPPSPPPPASPLAYHQCLQSQYEAGDPAPEAYVTMAFCRDEIDPMFNHLGGGRTSSTPPAA